MTIVHLTLTENLVCYAYITTVYPIAFIFSGYINFLIFSDIDVMCPHQILNLRDSHDFSVEYTRGQRSFYLRSLEKRPRNVSLIQHHC
jgi:hypothetical protein